jgi:hypothetical protein
MMSINYRQHEPHSPSEGKGQYPEHFEKALEEACPFYCGQVKHLLKDCETMRSYIKGTLDLKGKAQKPTQKADWGADDGKDEDTEFPDTKDCLMIFNGPHAYELRCHRRITKQEVNNNETIAMPTRLCWPEMAITFNRGQPDSGKRRLTKVLMDSGSELNILYTETLDKMKIPRRSLRPSRAPFYGVIPVKEALPLGHIRLHVTFGEPDNFRKEPLTFKVVDFLGTYHALLGQPCFTKFMVIPNYTYLKLKIPSPNGVIIVSANFQQAYYCDRECIALAILISSFTDHANNHDFLDHVKENRHHTPLERSGCVK